MPKNLDIPEIETAITENVAPIESADATPSAPKSQPDDAATLAKDRGCMTFFSASKAIIAHLISLGFLFETEEACDISFGGEYTKLKTGAWIASENQDGKVDEYVNFKYGFHLYRKC